MSFRLARRARHRNARGDGKGKGGLRGLFGAKAPEAAELAERIGKLAPRVFGRSAVTVKPGRVLVRLHPDAPAVTIQITPEAELEITAETLRLGPGYHVHVLGKLAPILEELELGWVADPDDPGDQLFAIQEAMAEHVAEQLAAGAREFGMPKAHPTFVLEAAVLTPLGPRDAAWRAAVIQDPLHCADAFPWWDSGKGSEPRSRALLALWHRAPPREPLDDDERELFARIDEDLEAAQQAGATIPDLAERARIGYRHHAVWTGRDAWTMALPGTFVAHHEADSDRWWATDRERVVELLVYEIPDKSSEALLAIAPAATTVLATEVSGTRHARADATTASGIHSVIGIVADAPHVAILTCRSEHADPAWALALWRSLRVSSASR